MLSFSSFSRKVNSFKVCFRDVNSWGKATHEYNKNLSITNSNDSTVIVFKLGNKIKKKNLLSGAVMF